MNVNSFVSSNIFSLSNCWPFGRPVRPFEYWTGSVFTGRSSSGPKCKNIAVISRLRITPRSLADYRGETVLQLFFICREIDASSRHAAPLRTALFISASSCGATNDRSARTIVDRDGTWTAFGPCACDSAASAHPIVRISTCSPPMCTDMASRLQQINQSNLAIKYAT
jgi:hypothetical protein